jgi:hypothetical protein
MSLEITSIPPSTPLHVIFSEYTPDHLRELAEKAGKTRDILVSEAVMARLERGLAVEHISEAASRTSSREENRLLVRLTPQAETQLSAAFSNDHDRRAVIHEVTIGMLRSHLAIS